MKCVSPDVTGVRASRARSSGYAGPNGGGSEIDDDGER
jgi:hypothetical protein